MTKRKNKKVTANRNYKDTVFRKLFSDRRNLLSLYNAINGTAYADETKLEIVTLENAIYILMAITSARLTLRKFARIPF